MAEVNSFEGLVSVRPKKRFGARYACGCAVNGESICGDHGIFGWIYGCGRGVCGLLECGGDDELTGIYQTRKVSGRRVNNRMNFYWPHNTNSEPQQSNRQKFGEAIVSWQGLTSEQKQFYNNKAIGKGKSGYNFYIGKYLKDN